MNDDDVLNAVKKTLSDIHMDRPVEAIEERSRERRHNRKLLGVMIGGGLTAVAALGLFMSMSLHQPGTAPAASDPLISGSSSTAGSAPAMKPAAFTLTTRTDGSVKLTLHPKKFLDPNALQKALAGAGIPAVVKAGVICEPEGKELPESDEVFQLEKAAADNAPTEYDLVIRPAKMPTNSEVYFSVFALQKGDGYGKYGKYLVRKGAPMQCHSIG